MKKIPVLIICVINFSVFFSDHYRLIKLTYAYAWTCDSAADESLKKGDYEAGILLHQRFLEKSPKNALALYHLGYAFGQTGNREKEVYYYEQAITAGYKENDGIFFNLGMSYFEKEQTEPAINVFRKCLEIFPKSPDCYFGIGMAFENISEDELSEGAFLEALKIDPKHLDARISLCSLYIDLGEVQKAKEHLKIVLEIDPNNDSGKALKETIDAFIKLKK